MERWLIDGLIMFGTCLCGTMLQGATGFGMALLCMAVLPFFMPLDLATISVMWLGAMSGLMIFWQLHKHFNWRLVAIPVIAVTVMRYFGIWIISGTDVTLLKGMLGAALIMLAIYLAFFNQKLRFKPNVPNGLIAGSISGLMGGMFNISGPPMVAYMFNATDDKLVYSACLQAVFFTGGITNAIFRYFRGTLMPSVGWERLVACIVGGLLASFIGSRVGVSFLKKMDRKKLSLAVYCMMAVSGIIYIVQALGFLPA